MTLLNLGIQPWVSTQVTADNLRVGVIFTLTLFEVAQSSEEVLTEPPLQIPQGLWVDPKLWVELV